MFVPARLRSCVPRPLPIQPSADSAAAEPQSTGAPDRLPVSETFVSIQGEGLLTGVPSLFIRLSGCNLRCAWCDTPYASWSPTTDGRGGGTRTIDDLAHEAGASGVSHAVLTGGEPMMFPQLVALSRRLGLRGADGGLGMHITIETAGTVTPPGWFDAESGGVCHLMSVSPKLSTSTPRNDPRDTSGVWTARHEQRRLNMPVLQRLLDEYPSPRRQLKFVVCTGRDLEEIDGVLGGLRGIAPTDVLLMPEGVAAPSTEKKDLVVRACLARGFRYCTRLHLDLFGNRRGT